MTIAHATAIRTEMLANQVGMRVARKALDQQKLQGQAAVALIRAAANVAKGAAPAPADCGNCGTGSVLDVTA